MDLKGKQKAVLKSLGQKLEVIVRVGDKGVTPTVIASLNEALEARELVKISIQNPDRNYRKECIAQLAAETGSTVVNIIGKTALLFRINSENPTISKKIF
jgi:RNA-binding protein